MNHANGGLRLAVIGPLPPPAGGMANQTRQLAELLAAEGLDVTVVQVNRPYRPAWGGKLRGARALFRLIPYLVDLWRTAGRVQVFHLLANSGWSWHLFSAPAVWIAWFRRVPVILNYRGGEAETFFNKSFHWVRPTLNRVSAIVVPSGFLREVFARRSFHSDIVPNVIDTACFFPAQAVETGNPAETGPCHVVVARNLEPIYDVATAIRAFSLFRGKIPSATMSIAGSGPERSALEGLARELGIADSVCFTGRLDRQEMAALYRRATVSLNPSLVDNTPNSVLESLASSLPVVSTNVGGVPYLVQDAKTALLVPPGDAEAMASAMLRLVNDPVLAASLIRNGQSLVQGFTWNHVREQLLPLYYRLSGLAAPPAPTAELEGG